MRRRRQRTQLVIALLACLPTAVVALLWLGGSASSVLGPGRALPEGSAVGIVDGGLQVCTASHALEFDDLPPAMRPPPGGEEGNGSWGRVYTGSSRALGAVEVKRGAEWHGRFATLVTLIVVPMWLLAAATFPFLLIAAWHLKSFAAAERRRKIPRCLNCGATLPPGAERCSQCGHLVATIDEVGRAMLGESKPRAEAETEAPASPPAEPGA